MNKNEIKKNVTRTLYKTSFKLKKHSPEILVVGGVIGVVASGIMACKATTKLSTILDESRDHIDAINEVMENPKIVSAEYTEEDAKKDKVIVYTQTGVKVAKLYAPSVILGALSISAILGGSNILRKRNIALAAAYATVDKSFKDYRGRVVERFGEELDKELKYNLKSKEVKEQVVDENGKKKTVKKTMSIVDPSDVGDFSRIFYEGNTGWDPNPLYTLKFLKTQQEWANQRLRAQGFLFLNDVYDMLGFSKIPEGQVIGWIYDEKNPIGDNFVDFGIFDMNKEPNIRFVNGDERGIILDFNHDGNILDKM